MHRFKIDSPYKPTGDQPQAIRKLTEGVEQGLPGQVLLGVTGSGKTFTIANVLANVNRPTLVLSHNKTLAAQLYGEFKRFFPENCVEYYVSYYDYYQPEAYIPSTDTYIEKDLNINEEIDRLRLRALSSLLSGRRDVIVVSSVSCIYGMGNPSAFYENVVNVKCGETIDRDKFLKRLVDNLYVRNDFAPESGQFRVKGETVDVMLAYSEEMVRISFWDDEITDIEERNPTDGSLISTYEEYRIYPANLFVTAEGTLERAMSEIKKDLANQVMKFNVEGKFTEAKRLQERVNYDMEMIKETGHCSGIENYSRYFDGREPGTRPYCLLDFFPKDYLMVIDESHVSVPQINAMYGGDRSRKESLVDYGFRLPAALDNRPLKFEEFQKLAPQVIYVSATPAEYELVQSEGVVVEQLIRPTGLLDPQIVVRPETNEIDDLVEEIRVRIERNERVLVTTLTKKMAEELSAYLLDIGINTSYIHSDVDTLERIKIMEGLRSGIYDVLVGVNLLREGLDLPEVSLVAVLDADKEGFLRSHRSLMQTAGRAARNVNGLVIMYAEKITDSMQSVIDETERHRFIQMKYNKEHNITPRQIKKTIGGNELVARADYHEEKISTMTSAVKVAEDVVQYNTPADIRKAIEVTRKEMTDAAHRMEFEKAALLRDKIIELEKSLNEQSKKHV
ncbi:MAG: excinuclease ABC subunit UvrB [Bacteroidaceae bacterium]|nr:excinuclease ABC subunit UvrB [Prevotellaceae bacterium]MDY4759766.1 excinuclease ABC subunit UvrB [Bacteroidaceae bacterium]